MKRTRKAEQGFTLIEILVAVVMVVAGVVSAAAIFMTASRANTLAEQIANAATAARDKTEQLRALDFDTHPSIQPGGSLENDLADYSDTYAAGTGAGRYAYRRRWQVFDNTAAAPNGPPTPNTRTVVVRVMPASNLAGTSKVVELRTTMVDPIN